MPFLTPTLRRVYVKLKLDHAVLIENSLEEFGVISKMIHMYAVEQLIAVGILFTYTTKSSGPSMLP